MADASTYADRAGYDVAFLQPGKTDGRVFLPKLSPRLLRQATRLDGVRQGYVLRYHHYSVVLHAKRRFAIYSAANVDFEGRFGMSRPKDKWLWDPRVPRQAQVGPPCYEKNQFDRGHLTRREDLEFGDTEAAAMVSAADTCHWTNCTPQAAGFNEGKQLWQGLERHLLEDAVSKDRFRAQVITGPVFDAGDPVVPGFPDIQYPLRYWKVVAAINASGKLFATAYVLDQRSEVEQVRGAPEIPFTPYKTFQTSIREIERLTELSFSAGSQRKRVPLAAFDPLAKARDSRPYIRLTSPDQIVRQ